MAYLKTGCIFPEAKVPGLPEAREKLRYHSMKPEEKRAYDRHIENIMIQNDILSSALISQIAHLSEEDIFLYIVG